MISKSNSMFSMPDPTQLILQMRGWMYNSKQFTQILFHEMRKSNWTQNLIGFSDIFRQKEALFNKNACPATDSFCNTKKIEIFEMIFDFWKCKPNNSASNV